MTNIMKWLTEAVEWSVRIMKDFSGWNLYATHTTHSLYDNDESEVRVFIVNSSNDAFNAEQ